MRVDDYKFKATVFVDNDQVSADKIYYNDYITAVDAAQSIADCEYKQNNKKLEIYIELIAIVYDSYGEIISAWCESTLYHTMMKDIDGHVQFIDYKNASIRRNK